MSISYQPHGIWPARSCLVTFANGRGLTELTACCVIVCAFSELQFSICEIIRADLRTLRVWPENTMGLNLFDKCRRNFRQFKILALCRNCWLAKEECNDICVAAVVEQYVEAPTGWYWNSKVEEELLFIYEPPGQPDWNARRVSRGKFGKGMQYIIYMWYDERKSLGATVHS